ncbi:MAG TPA: DUF6152 family protein [Vicinamibacterales bacterium]|nr:DUF6152 family protein [Vicinamibacterales bacterium]
MVFLFAFVSFVSARPGAQEGHPLTGTWTGDVGARHVTVALEWDGKTIIGTINPGPNAAKITAATMDVSDISTWTIHIEAEGKERVAVDGRITHITSPGRTLSGTWTEAGVRSPITLARVDATSSSSNSGDAPRAIVYGGAHLTLRGKVTGVEWINPRVRFAVSDRASRRKWTIELPDGATALERSGYGAGSLKVGDVVTVRAVAAPAERNRALASAVTAGRGGALLFKLSVTTHRTDGPVPRWPDGHVQLGPPPGSRGYWKADVAELDLTNLKAGQLAAMPWAKAVYAGRQLAKLRDDPFERCVPPGGPRQFLGPQGFQFVDLHTRVLVLLGDGNRNWRIIHTDGRPLAESADAVPSYYGTSVGRWDGDALVVDSVGYNEKFWFHRGGLPHTEALHLTERFTRTDLSTLKYEVTVDDFRTYTKPWTMNYTMRWVAGQELQEFFCEEKTS